MRTVLALGLLAGVAAQTCGEVKAFYKANKCCGNPTTKVDLSSIAPKQQAASCPYNFNKPACKDAEPQTPRDLTMNAGKYSEGMRTPKAAVLNEAQAKMLPLVNVHFHLGAEHKSDSYKDDSDSKAYDANKKGTRRLADVVRPGYMCSNAGLSADQLKEYTFKYCKGQTQVGKSYEVHYVHSSAAGYNKGDAKNAEMMADGLGGAANGRGMLNPMVVVQGQVFQIVQGGATVDDLLHGWSVVDHTDSVMYTGSTTGPSHNNEICSPYVITWHVDKQCHQVSPESWDKLCKDMKEQYNLDGDLYPHGSRILVDKAHVVKAEYVTKLA